MGLSPCLTGCPPRVQDIPRNFKRRIGPVDRSPRRDDFVCTQWATVRRFCAFFIWRTLADQCPASNQRWTVICKRRLNCAFYVIEIMTITCLNMPSTCTIACGDVFTRRQVRCAINRYAVIVPEYDQTAETQMSGKPDCFVINAFHQAAVASHNPCPVVDQIVAEARIQVPFGNGHSNSHGKPLPKRTRCTFNAIDQKILWMASAWAPQLAEVFDVFDGRTCIAREIQGRIREHRPVPCGQHKTVTIGPMRGLRIKFQKL